MIRFRIDSEVCSACDLFRDDDPKKMLIVAEGHHGRVKDIFPDGVMEIAFDPIYPSTTPIYTFAVGDELDLIF